MNAESEIQALREALAYYADRANYVGFLWPIAQDRGQRARLALVASGREDAILAAGIDAARHEGAMS